MRTLFKNAKVYIDKGHFEQAVLVDGDRIAAVGSDEYVENAANLTGKTDLKIIDCEGRTLIPSFADSHMHLFGLALNLSQAKIQGAGSVEEIVDICRSFADENPDRVRKGMYAAGWNQDLFTGDKRMPSIDDADSISTEFPVCLERTCGHIVVCNHKLLERMDEEGVELTEEQRQTGIFTEGDVKAPKQLVTRYTKEDLAEMVMKAMQRCASFGLSSVASNDAEFVFKDHDLVEGALGLIFAGGRAPVRYRQQISFGSACEFKRAFEEGVFSRDLSDYSGGNTEYSTGRTEFPEWNTERSAERAEYIAKNADNKTGTPGDAIPWYTAGPLKLFADGSLGARTAHLRAGYADDPDNHGLETISREELREYCLAAKEAGMQVVTHGIGDGAVEKIIDIYEEVFGPDNPKRCGIIHCQVTDTALLKRIASLNIPTLVQPIFLDYDIMIAEDRCGSELAGTSYAFRSLAEDGHMSFGTDCPVEDCNPFDGIYSAVTRKCLDGSPDGGWFAHECMDVSSAIDAYTMETAYIEFAEDRRGRIKEGFAADMVLLDRDIFMVAPEEIKDIRPLITMTAGKITFSALSMT